MRERDRHRKYVRGLKIHYLPIKNSPEIACLGWLFPVRTTRNIDKVTCKTCLKAKWYKMEFNKSGVGMRLKKG